MKRAESTPLAKLLLLPLVPALALGIVEVASHIALPTNLVAIDTPPDPAPDPAPCDTCVMPA